MSKLGDSLAAREQSKRRFLAQVRQLAQTIANAEHEREDYAELAREYGATEREIEEAEGL